MKTTLPTLLAALLTACTPAHALPDNARVPVLTYHSWETSTCDNTEPLALLRDLRTLHSSGYTPVPAYWIAEWVRGDRDGYTLPSRAIVLTMDDGYDLDFLDNTDPGHECAPLRSIRSVLEEAATWDWQAPAGMPVPHMTTFVIASPLARLSIRPDGRMADNWWSAASAHPLLEVQNHGLDHNHESITPGPDWLLADRLGLDRVDIPAAAGGPHSTSLTIDTWGEAADYVELAAQYIEARTGLWPDLFAYPYGPAPGYLRAEYFPRLWNEHRTYAAFCAGGQYVTRQSDPYCLPRFVHRSSPQYGGWRDEAELLLILSNSQRRYKADF